MIGRQISHFYIIRQLGSGGMGVVYEAQDTRLPRSVAIKFLNSTLSMDRDALRRFKREARLASSLNHPNICTILDVEEGEGQSFIAMELLHGRSLKARLSTEPLQLNEILDIAVQVADALAAAHDQGIIHRDITPGNVFLTESGLVKVLDFGLAKKFPTLEGDGQTTDDLTAAGAVVGTLHYMAPEQLAADASVDYRCDLFSLGVLLYQMAAGARPFDISPRNALISAIQSQPHVPLRQLSPQHPAELERITDKLLAKRPEDRYQSARTLRTDLDGLRSGLGETTSPARDMEAYLGRWSQASRSDGPPSLLRTALADRYSVGAELGRGGMATVYVADDLRHHRRVALKVLDPDLGAMLGAERFLAEIRVTASLQHPNLLPLFDSGDAGGLLYYVMPLIEGASLRARLDRERQLPVDEAVRIVSAIAGALDYVHRHGVVHRDLKPGNILLQDGQPLVADFGIALAVARAGGTHLTAPGISLGTPQYMSPEQAASDAAVDGRSDIYSLACVLYELLAGDPPFTGKTAQAVIAKVISDAPSSVRTVRPSVPAHVEAALGRALAKLPADRYATAREFADALVLAPVPGGNRTRTRGTRWRDPIRLVLGAVATAGLATAAWMVSRTPAAPVEITQIPYHNLIDQSIFSAVTITPNGRALVYSGSSEAGRPIMLLPLDQLAARALAGTEGAGWWAVAPDGRRLAFLSRDNKPKLMSIDGTTFTDAANGWRYGNHAWVDDSTVVTAGGPARGLKRRVPGGSTEAVLTEPDSARGESKHQAPLVLPGRRVVVFTVSIHGGPAVVGPLAITSLDPSERPSPHVWLGVEARRAFAFVDGWLLFTSADGIAIMAVQLDVKRQRIIGTPVSVLEEAAGSLETAELADNGTLLYVRQPRFNAPALVDSTGAVHRLLASAAGPFMYPRLSPDGKRFAVQAANAGGGNDVWVYDIATRTATQLTTTGRALHPTWTPDGRRIVFMAAGSAGLMSQPVDGGGAAEKVVGTEGAFAPTVAPDGKSVVFQGSSPNSGWSVWSASLSGEGARRKVVDDPFLHYMPAVSPDGHWLADVSRATGRNEVYVRPFPGPGQAVQVSDSGGTEPAWSQDGHRIYYRAKGAFMAAVVTTPALAITSRKQLFKDAFDGAMPHRNYDVAPDGTGFLMITGGSSEAVVVLNWLAKLRERLARER